MQRHVRGGRRVWSVLESAGIGPAEAWIAYESLGGSRSQAQLVAYVLDQEGWSRTEHNVLVLAINTLLRIGEHVERLAFVRGTAP